MGCLIIFILFAICVGGGAAILGVPGAVIGFLLFLFLAAKLNSF